MPEPSVWASANQLVLLPKAPAEPSMLPVSKKDNTLTRPTAIQLDSDPAYAPCRYVSDRRLPDSAIDLMDEAAAMVILRGAAAPAAPSASATGQRGGLQAAPMGARSVVSPQTVPAAGGAGRAAEAAFAASGGSSSSSGSGSSNNGGSSSSSTGGAAAMTAAQHVGAWHTDSVDRALSESRDLGPPAPEHSGQYARWVMLWPC
jgi:hypothetical protein